MKFSHRWKRLLRTSAFASVALVTLAALTASWLSFTGRRDWAEIKASLLARGEKLTLVELAPPPLPDEENTFGGPFWASRSETPSTPFEIANRHFDATELAGVRRVFSREIGNSQEPRRSRIAYMAATIRLGDDLDNPLATSILSLLSPLSLTLAELPGLLDRPGARSHMDYADPAALPFDPYPGLNDIAQALSARAQANLALGQVKPAAQDVDTLFRLADKLRSDPLLYSQMLRLGILACVDAPIRAGLRRQAWPENDLRAIQHALERVDNLSCIALAFRGERGFFNQTLESLRTHRRTQEGGLPSIRPARRQIEPPFPLSGPARPFYLGILASGDQAAHNRISQEIIDSLDRAAGRQSPFQAPQKIELSSWVSLFTTPLAANNVHLLGGIPGEAAEQENQLTMLAAACALERYRIRRGSYPDRLDVLVPEDLDRMPLDVFTLTPLSYKREMSRYHLQTSDGTTWP